MSTMETVVPILLLGESRRSMLQEKLRLALKDWIDHWIPGLDVCVEVVAETDDRWEDQEVIAMRGSRVASLTEESADMAILLRRGVAADLLGFGEDAGGAVGDIAAELEAKLVVSFREHVTQTLGGSGAWEHLNGAHDCLHFAQTKRWTPIAVRVRSSHPFALVLLSPAVISLLSPVRTATPATKSLQSRRSSIRANTLQVVAIVGSAEVAFADLASLAVGDVLVLEEGLEAPVKLLTEKGDQIASGQLGQAGDKRAVSVTIR